MPVDSQRLCRPVVQIEARNWCVGAAAQQSRAGRRKLCPVRRLPRGAFIKPPALRVVA